MGLILQRDNVDISLLEVGKLLLSEHFHYIEIKLSLEIEIECYERFVDLQLSTLIYLCRSVSL